MSSSAATATAPATMPTGPFAPYGYAMISTSGVHSGGAALPSAGLSLPAGGWESRPQPASCGNDSDTLVHDVATSSRREFKCRYCDFTSPAAASVEGHERRHTGEKPFQCRYCPYVAARKGQVTVHERTHTNERPLQCPFCPMRFKASGSLHWHKNCAHADLLQDSAKYVALRVICCRS